MNKNEKSEAFGPGPFTLEYLLITKVFFNKLTELQSIFFMPDGCVSAAKNESALNFGFAQNFEVTPVLAIAPGRLV